MIFVCWKKDTTRRGRVFPALTDDHPCYTQQCVECGDPLGDGLPVQLIAVCPDPEDEDEWQRYTDNRWHTAMAVCLHAPCAEALSDDELDDLVLELRLVEASAPATT